MTDEQLMQRYVGGDAAAFDALYARHEAALYRFVRRALGSGLVAQADEVFQDTWLRLVAARDRYAPQGATWRTWLFTIATIWRWTVCAAAGAKSCPKTLLATVTTRWSGCKAARA